MGTSLYYSPMLEKKPYCSATQLVDKMERKGITFQTISKDDAAKYLTEKNNFLRLYAYRKNFQKAQLGKKKGKYVNLDFCHLKALAILDLQLRKWNGESKTYCIDMPIWVLLESITFGGLIRFYNFYYEYYEQTSPIPIKLLNSIKSIRNACAHNNCILHDLSENQCCPHAFVRTFVSRKGCSKPMIQSRLTCRTLHEFASVLYLANKRFGNSTFLPTDILQHDLKEIQGVLAYFEHKYLKLFQKNDTILSSFRFLKKIVDF